MMIFDILLIESFINPETSPKFFDISVTLLNSNIYQGTVFLDPRFTLSLTILIIYSLFPPSYS
jgi:hypothetical protein